MLQVTLKVMNEVVKTCLCGKCEQDDGTEKCYLDYSDEGAGAGAVGYLTCTYNHKEGEKCLMIEKELFELTQ